MTLTQDAEVRALIEHCRGQLAAFKVPTRIHVLAEIPRTPTGKVQRRRVAEFVPGQDPGSAQGLGGPVKFAVLGAGAIGAYVGAALARGGADVTLIARGAHLARDASRRRPGHLAAGRLRRPSPRDR